MKKACLQEVPGISVLALILVLSLADCKSERKKGPAGTGTSVSEKGEAAPSAERAAGKRRFRKPSRFYAHGPSSLLKVEAAEREGKLDAEKALICRFMALFDPGKLSAEYRSLSPIPCGTSVLRAFRKAKGTLSPETLETLKPYLVRPSDPQSIFARRIAGMKKQASCPPVPGSGLLFAQIDPAGERPENNPRLPDWYGAASTSAPVTVWSRASYAEARKALAFVDGHDMYGKFKKLLGTEPLSDINAKNGDGTPNNGIDGDLDIYLVPSDPYLKNSDGTCLGFCVGIETGQKIPCWILIDETLAGDDLGSTLAHEIFHAFQYAVDSDESDWWMEGTAVWSEGYIKDWESEPEQGYLVDAFDSARFKLKTLTLEEDLHEYAIYIFPFFLSGRYGDSVVGDIWKACAASGPNALEAAVDGAKKASGKEFEDVFKDFALLNYDDTKKYRPPYPEELDVFGYHEEEEIELNKDNAAATINLPPLSAFYLRVTDAIEDKEATPSVLFDLREFKKNPKLGIQAVVRYGERDEVEDWTGMDEKFFCVDSEVEDFQDIILVFSSAEGKAEVLGLNLPIYVGHDARCDAEWVGTFTYAKSTNCSDRSEGEWIQEGTWRKDKGSPWEIQESKLDVEQTCSIGINAHVRMALAPAAKKAASEDEKELHELFAIVGGQVVYTQDRIEGNYNLDYTRTVKETTTYKHGGGTPFVQTSTNEAHCGGKLIPYGRSILLAPRLSVDYKKGEYTLEINFAFDGCQGEWRVEDNRGHSSKGPWEVENLSPLFDSYPLRRQWDAPALKGTFNGKTISGNWSSGPGGGDRCATCDLTALENARVTWTLTKIR